jgi:hypothetical protein
MCARVAVILNLLVMGVPALMIGTAHVAFGQNTEAPVVAPVQKAPFHLTVLSNEFVSLLNATIPPGRTAAYHRHELDTVLVIVETARVKNQVLGGEPVEGKLPQGAVSYGSYASKPLSHQLTNVDTNPLHIVGFEIVYPEARRFSPSTRADVPAYQSVLDNDRVRGWRLVLEPGQSVPTITTKAPGVRIVVRGGELVETEPGQQDRGMSLRPADVMWQEANVTRALQNAGTTSIELVEFELK